MASGIGTVTPADPALPAAHRGLPISLGRVTVLLLGGRSLGFVLGFINAVVLARVLGAEQLGVFAYAVGIASLLGLLPGLGVTTVLSRAVARDPAGAEGLFGPVFRVQISLAAVAAVAVPALAVALPGQPAPLSAIVLAGATVAVGAMSWPYLAVLSGRALYGAVARAELVAAVGGTITLLLAALLDGGVVAFLAARLLGAGVALWYAAVSARPWRPGSRPPAIGARALLRSALPFGGAGLAQSLYTRLDVVLLGQLAAPVSLGLYSAAYRPITLVAYAGGTVGSMVFTLMARASGAALPEAYRRAVRLLFVVAPVMALALTGLAAPLMAIVYGRDFAAAAAILGVLAWAAAVKWLYVPLGTALQASGRERWWFGALFAGLVVNAVANVVAIPRWGGAGAAGALVVSEIVVLAVAVAASTHLAAPMAGRTGLVVVAGALAGAGALWLASDLGAWLSTAAALSVYASMAVGFRVVGASDARLLLGWVRDAARVRAS